MSALAWGLIIISLITQGILLVLQMRLMRTNTHKQGVFLALISTSSLASMMLCVLLGLTAIWPVLGINGFEPPENWLDISDQLVYMTILYAVANVCNFEALRFITPALSGLVFTKRVAVVNVAAYVFLGELFGWLKISGMLLIIAGIVFATIKRPGATEGPKDKDYVRGLALSVTGTTCFGLASTADAVVLDSFDAPSYLLVRLMLPMLLVAAVAFVRWFKPADVIAYVRVRERWPLLAGVAICLVVSAATFMLAYQESGKIGLLSGIHQLSLFVTIGFSAIGNKAEQKQIPAYGGAALVCLIGVAMMRWQS